MHNYKKIKNNLSRIKDLFHRLLHILETEGDNDVNYAKNELVKNIQMIEDVLGSNSNPDPVDLQEIFIEIKVSFKSMYPSRGGLSDFFVWREDFEKRLEANKLLDSIQDELKTIFNM